jgi:hypothetical protein
MSVTWAPRARMALNAAWPGVSEEGDLVPVLGDHLISADVLGDPAGLADTTLVLRSASSSEVLPWST